METRNDVQDKEAPSKIDSPYVQSVFRHAGKRYIAGFVMMKEVG